MDKNQLPPDYTPFSLTGSAEIDGDRQVEKRLSAPAGIVALALLFGLLLAAILL